MTLLEFLAIRTRQHLDSSSVFSSSGELKDPDTFSQIMDLEVACVIVFEIKESEYCYINSRFAEKISMPAGFVARDDQHRFTHNFDPSTVMHIFSLLEHFRSGHHESKQGIVSIGEKENESVFCESYATPLAFDPQGLCTYAAMFLTPMNEKSLLGVLRLLGEKTLTPRQWETCRLLIAGFGNAEIAEKMGISIKTLEKHILAVFSATGCQNQTTLINSLRQIKEL